ncbi:MAG: pyruvate ferredoxin oxidoreductase [Gammaproteobacteria bacterium]|nr:pyruvate ferredoxin oxidoreductase [Gammaproteobacteria bacterium]
MAGLRDIAIQWYRRAFGAPAGSDIRDEGFTTVLDGNGAVGLSETAMSSRAVTDAEGPRGVLAAATGLTLAGHRATAYLSGHEIAAVQDLLVSAAGRHAPLVVHLATRSAAAHGAALGSGHDTVHLSADAGCFVLFAANVQEAADFSFIARRVSEQTLVPGLVVMDGEQTALAAQDVRLLSPNQVARFLGAAGEEIETPTAAQKLLFGARRRRLPAWHDLDEPMLTGAVFDRESFGLGAAARRPYFDDFVDDALARAFEDFDDTTGRRYDTISQHRLDNARLVLIAQGAAVETARRTSDLLRKQHRIRAGVVGLHALRPFPGAAIADAIEAVDRVIVLERGDAALSGGPPLTREIRASVYGTGRQPACQTAVYGVGGLPLRVEDLITLCADADDKTPDPAFLGIAFDDDATNQPKREVLLDALRRAYPHAAGMGVRARQDAAAPRQKDSLAIKVRRSGKGARLTRAAAALLHTLEGGRIRSRPGPPCDWLIHGGDHLLDPGDAIGADVTLDVARRVITLHRENRHFRVPDGEPGEELLLGGLFAALLHGGLLEQKSRRIVGARRKLLEPGDAERRDDMLAAFEKGLEALEETGGPKIPSRPPYEDTPAPAAVRALGRSDDHVASLPRFWDQTGILYRDGETDRLTADPYFATGSMPPLSATFGDNHEQRAWLPAFDPAACTGCGKCWTRCPDSAIGIVAAGPAALIDAGIRETGAEAVRQVAGKLASRILADARKSESPPPRFGDMLGDAWTWLMEKAPLPDERKQAIADGVEKIDKLFGALPVAVTAPFFGDAEAKNKDSGELLSLVVNADACQACGICVQACEPGALEARDTDATFLAEARALWDAWSATPDTPGATLVRAAGHDDVGPAAAMLLSRYCQFAMAGSDVGEAGSGEKAAVRLALSTIEYHQQPVVQRFANELSTAGAELTTMIRETLSGTLPVEDLDAVSEQLESLASPRVDLSTLAERISGGDVDHSVDTAYLLRLIELSRDVASAHHRLIEGEYGLGRARYGLAITGATTASWAARFPANPFQVPAVVDASGDAPLLARGLVEGHLEETTNLARLLRLARLELERPDGLDWKRDALADLRWQDLDDDELALCPPLLLVGGDDMLAGRGLAQLIWLLNAGLPVKVLLLSSLGLGLTGAETRDAHTGAGMLALSQRNAYVAQSSIAWPDHFSASLAQALEFRGPALIEVYAPSPSRDGFAAENTIEQARLAVETRVLPLFRYDPRRDGVFGTRISLEGNPDESDAGPADWMRGQARFAAHADTPALETAADSCMQNWQTLQELAGEVTPFTAKVEEHIRADVAAEHQAELDAQQQAAAAELAEIRDKTRAEIAVGLRSRLLELAKRGKDR